MKDDISRYSRRHNSAKRVTPHVLVVGSDEDSQELINELLKSAFKRDVNVHAERSIGDALTQLHHQLPDCLLLDITATTWPILEALGHIANAFDNTLPCPVIVLDDLDAGIDTADVLSAGAQDRIAKQWLSPLFLRRAIDNAVERHRMQHQATEQAQELKSVYARLKLAHHAAQMGHWTYDLVSGAGEVDELCAKLCDRSVEELAAPGGGMEHIHPDDRAKVQEALERALTGGRYSCEFRSVRRDGSVHWLAGMGDAIYDVSGTAQAFTGVVWDIDQQKRAELRRAQLLDELIALAFMIDLNGNLLDVNKVALSAVGCTREALIGVRFDQSPWWPQDQRAQSKIWSCVQSALHGNECHTEADYLVAPSNTLGKLKLKAAPAFDEHGNVEAVVVSGVDITSLVNAEAGLQNALADSQRKEAFNLALLDSSPDCVKVLNTDGSLILINNPGLALMEIPSGGHFVGQPWEQFWPEEARASVRKAVQRASQGDNYAFDAFCPTFSGTPKWWSVSVSPVRDNSGKVVRLLAVSRDISEQRAAENAIKRSEKVLRSITDNTPDVLSRFDREYRHLYVNEAVIAASGLQPKEFIGKSNREMGMPDNLCDPWEAVLEAAFTSGEQQTFQFEFASPSGERYFEARVVPEKNAAGHVETLLCITRDVTDLRKIERQLRKSKAEAVQANKTKDHFLAVLSHELRTPLTPVLAAVAELCKRQDLPPDVLSDLTMVNRNVELEARLMDDLLDLTRISRGKLNLNNAALDVHKKIKRVEETVFSDANSKRLSMNFCLNADLSNVHGDSTRVQQILWNLLKNAIKFTPPGGAITVKTDNLSVGGQDSIRVIVQDTGKGISAEQLPQIFNAFEQGGAAITRQFGGLGLGLAISKVLTDLHGGTLSASSEGEGQGAIFTLTLPISTAMPVTNAATSHVNMPLTHKRILLVEDHPDTLSITAKLLTAHGMTVHTESTVADALRALNAETFDIMVSDLGLPDGSGISLMRQAKASNIAPPSVAVSGFGSEKDRAQTREAGFAEHLTKPIALEQLLQAIRKTL